MKPHPSEDFDANCRILNQNTPFLFMIDTYPQTFPIIFSDRLQAKGFSLQNDLDLYHSLLEMGLAIGRPTLVVIGGAQFFGAVGQQVHNLFSEVLVPIAQKWNANVIDGGTNSGVMQLMGQARSAAKASFPLIGVVPADLAVTPDEKNASEERDGDLEPNHTHFFLVPGKEWGDESPWLAEIATALTGDAPSVTILINGGEITWKDAQANVDEDRTLIAIEGTGRAADRLASVAHGQDTDDRATQLVQSGLVKITNLKENKAVLSAMIEDIFQYRKSLHHVQQGS
jgi:SLOG in TRPM, prokaryote